MNLTAFFLATNQAIRTGIALLSDLLSHILLLAGPHCLTVLLKRFDYAVISTVVFLLECFVECSLVVSSSLETNHHPLTPVQLPTFPDGCAELL